MCGCFGEMSFLPERKIIGQWLFLFGYLRDIFFEKRLRIYVTSRKIVSFVASEEVELGSEN